MRPDDVLHSARRSLATQRLRAVLTLLAVAIGAASVVALASLGEGARRYVLDEFSQLGTNLVVVMPGRNETTGGAPPMLGETPRDLTLNDALALLRSPHVDRMAPLAVGEAPVSVGALEREVTVMGTTADFVRVRQLEMAVGRFLPPGDAERGGSVTVLGQTLVEALFGNADPIGARVRISDRRFRVIGVLESTGVSMGQDLGDLAVVPVNQAQALFDETSLFRIILQARGDDLLEATAEDVRRIIRERHEGEDDVTVVTQDAILGSFDRILSALTLAIAGIGAISLLVAGVLIMNVMWVAVSQRTAEVGLLKALGARDADIRALFLTEALLLSATGTLIGIALAFLGVLVFNGQFEAFNLVVPFWSPLAAALVSIGGGLLFGLWPAQRAARLDPVAALAGR